EGAPHDFVCGSIDIEVKSSLKTSGDIVEINGLGQLEPKPGSELYLQFLKLLKAPGRGRSLVALVRSISDACSDLHAFHSKLEMVGFSLEHEAAYEGTQFEVAVDRVYPVDDSFGALVPSWLGQRGLPTPFVYLQYRMDLALVSSSPLGAEALVVMFARAASEIRP